MLERGENRASGSTTPSGRPIEILLVEDSPGDVRLTTEFLKEAAIANNVRVAGDGIEALRFLRREGKHADAPRPDLILLDLNLPCKDGREVLAEIKTDRHLRQIPVVVLTTSGAEQAALACTTCVTTARGSTRPTLTSCSFPSSACIV